MENLLQIDIFDQKIRSKYKSKTGSSDCDRSLETVVRSMLHGIDRKLHITIYGRFDENGTVFFPGNMLRVDVFDSSAHDRTQFYISSSEELEDRLSRLQSVSRVRKQADVKEIDYLVFRQDVFMMILALTQQFFMFEDVSFEKNLSVLVRTPMGKQPLISEGKSNRLMQPALTLEDCEGVDELQCDEDRMIWAVSLNNIISSINIKTGEYSLSLETETTDGERSTVYCIFGCKDFWQGLKKYTVEGETFFAIGKGVQKK